MKINESFPDFLAIIWHHLGLPKPTPVQLGIAQYLQHGPKRKIIMAFRGVGKSWITSAYVLWNLLRDPELKILVVSASKARADDFSTFCHRLIQAVPILNHLWPDATQRQSKVAWDVRPATPAHAPSVKSVGIYGQLTGARADIIIADDVEVAQNSATEDMRDKLFRACLEFEAILAPKPEAQIIFLGTPQSEETIYNKLRERGYKARIWPARYPAPDRWVIYGGDLAPSLIDETKADQPVDPTRFSGLELAEREASYGRSGFLLQFMIDTSLSDQERYPLKLRDLIVMDLDPLKGPSFVSYGSSPDQLIKDLRNVGFSGDRWFRPLFYDRENWTDYQGSVMAIDPAGRGADKTGYACVKHLNGKLFITAAGIVEGGYEQTALGRLAKIAAEQQVNTVLIEANFGDGMFTELFKPVLFGAHKADLEEIKHNVQKEKRIIDTLEPVLNQHRLIVNTAVVLEDLKRALDDNMRYHSLFYQLTHISRIRGALKHDDALDALAMAVGYLSKFLGRSPEEALEAWKEQELDRMLESFMEHVIVKPKGPKTWHEGFYRDRFRFQ